MRKATGKTIIGVVFGVAMLVCGSVFLGSVKESVIITEEVLYGDTSVVEDMTLKMSTSMDGNHIWDMQVPLGNAKDTEVEYVYYTEHQEPEYDYRDEFQINTVKSGGMTVYDTIYTINEEVFDESRGRENFPIKAIAAVASRANKGKSYTETVSYSDYYTEYPYDITLSIYDGYRNYNFISDEGLEKLYDYFSFPIIEGDEIEITVTHDETHVEASVGNSDPDGTIDIWNLSVVDDVGIYFASQMRRENWETGECVLYTSPEVTYIPYVKKENDFEGQIEIGEISPLLTMSEDTQILSMEDGGDVIIMTLKEGGQSLFRTYSKENFGLIKEIELPIIAKDYSLKLLEEAVYVEGKENTFVVLKKEDNQYSIVIEGTKEAVVVEEKEGYFAYDSHYFYIDDKLVIVSNYGDMVVTCYDAEGLVYAGKYHNSQSDEVLIEDEYELNVMPFGEFDM